MRTVIYARFSSLLQNSRSIEDQIAVCRDRCEREGWTIIDIFTDYAISGAAGIGEGQRPGLAAMLARVEAGGIDQVLAEATDRIARHQGDSFTIRERLTYARCRLFTLSDGEVTDISGTFKGLMDAQFRKELGAKIRRGQKGTIASGRSPAGLAYGYRTANRIDASGRPVRGLREIDPEQSEVVRRIFRLFVDGQSARTIAGILNAEGIPGPRGAIWRASTINGDGPRGNGILRNELYVGHLVHNRTSKVVNPVDRKVRIRVNPATEWTIEAVPHLRIIAQEDWDATRSRFDHTARKPLHTRVRPRRMLSGLGQCGVCGGSWIVVSGERWGCKTNRAEASCTNTATISTKRFEERVLAGLKTKMLDPDIVAIFVKEYHEEYARRAAETRRDTSRLQRTIDDADRKIARLVEAIAAGGGEFAEVKDALAKARMDRDAARDSLAEVEALPVVALHPSVAADYRREVEQLHKLLKDPEAKEATVPALRALIDRVVLTPAPVGRGVEIEIEGRLAAILKLATGGRLPPSIEADTPHEEGEGKVMYASDQFALPAPLPDIFGKRA
ncbi:recombinase family protein [Sphingomonas sp. Leaf257]|uniref:recombinase family protein n=1 Tax=Sphingomonas sp. Leaf257 TaxID=1736309 RepID=UPI000ACF0748|nr:recombinase family protein [Sphingomonas sp. Leaf257]